MMLHKRNIIDELLIFLSPVVREDNEIPTQYLY
jgi:hypothetical protein